MYGLWANGYIITSHKKCIRWDSIFLVEKKNLIWWHPAVWEHEYFCIHTYHMCPLMKQMRSPGSSSIHTLAPKPLSHFSNLCKSGEHFCWLVYQHVTPIYCYLCQRVGRWCGEVWEQEKRKGRNGRDGGFDEAYFWIIKTHQSLVESRQPCCWCRESVSQPRGLYDRCCVCCQDTRIPCVDMKCLSLCMTSVSYTSMCCHDSMLLNSRG